MKNDPFGYYERKAARESALRNAAPYRIDDGPEIVPSFDALESRLRAVSLSPGFVPFSCGAFGIYDDATGILCGRIVPVRWGRFAGTSIHADKARAEEIAASHAAAYPGRTFAARPASTGGYFIGVAID